jgi:hypothetical protein
MSLEQHLMHLNLFKHAANASQRKLRLWVCGCWRSSKVKGYRPYLRSLDRLEEFADDPVPNLVLRQDIFRFVEKGFDIWDAVGMTCRAATDDMRGNAWESHVELFRDLFPEEPFDVPRTENVVALAETIYRDRAFEIMPVLADALDDAGAEDAARHCRTGRHWLGCWVLDAATGRG